jgi:HEAT repeat protein
MALARLGDESAIPALDRALSTDPAATRQAAVEALAALAAAGSRSARSRLHGLFDDPDGLVRVRARQAWTDAYLGDPMRQQRTRPSLVLVGISMLLMLSLALHGLISRQRA